MKPVGYYTRYTPGDTGLLAEMQEAWGGGLFAKLTTIERLWMVTMLAEDLCAEEAARADDDTLRASVEEAMQERLAELDREDKLGLILALVEQVRHAA